MFRPGIGSNLSIMAAGIVREIEGSEAQCNELEESDLENETDGRETAVRA